MPLQFLKTQRWPLFEISANDLNHVFIGFFRGFRILWHVVEDVVFHDAEDPYYLLSPRS